MVILSNEIFRHLIPQCDLKFCCLGSKFCGIFLIDFLSFNSIPSLIPILLVEILSLTLIYFQLIIRLGDWQIFMLIETFNIPTSIRVRYLDTCLFISYIHPFIVLIYYTLILCFIPLSFCLLVHLFFLLLWSSIFSMCCYRMLFSNSVSTSWCVVVLLNDIFRHLIPQYSPLCCLQPGMTMRSHQVIFFLSKVIRMDFTIFNQRLFFAYYTFSLDSSQLLLINITVYCLQVHCPSYVYIGSFVCWSYIILRCTISSLCPQIFLPGNSRSTQPDISPTSITDLI